ncbi:MAG: hypothetical protein AB1295_06345 [Candidatus Micrarchaeota archaeon]
MEGGLDFAIKYPFSESAKSALAGAELTERIVELAVERIQKALKGDKAARMLLHDPDKREELASFAAARMILGSLRNNFLTNSFAVNESKRVRDFLDREDDAALERIAGQFGIKATGHGDGLTIDLPTYLKYSTRNPHYRLINRRLIEGRVEIKREEKKRLMEEAVKKHMESIPFVKDPPPLIKKAGAKLIAELPQTQNRIQVTVKGGDHPPCIMKLLDELKKHQNLPHHARWFLASYLAACGVSEKDMVALFSNAPDFSEKVTAYQVSHIIKKGYSVPSCATVMTYGLCCAVCRIGTPLRWHELDDARKKAIKG